jgi:zinc protease
VTADQVQAAARHYFDEGELLTGLIVPRDKAADFARAPAADQAETPGKIEVSDIRKVTLDNGLTVLLRRNSAVPLAAIQVHFRGGLLGEPAGKEGISRLMVQAALRGTESRSAQQIFGAFERAGGSLGSQSGRNSFNFTASVLSSELADTLPIFADVVLNPSFPADELEKLRERALASIARVDDRLGSSASRFFFRNYFGDHPYGNLAQGTVESVKNLSADDLVAFHDRFVVAPNGVLAIFGDIDLDATEALVRKLFGQMEAAPDFKLPDVPAPKPPAEDRTAVQPFKQTEAAQVDFGFPGVKFTSEDFYPLTMLDTMISGYGLPGGWLHEELRGRQLVYVVHAVNLAWADAGCFWIYAQCQPEKVDTVVEAIRGQLERARKGELTEQMLANAKALMLARELLDNQTNDQLAYQAALDELLGRGYDHFLKLSDRVKAVTLEDVNRMVEKYLTHAVITVTTGKPDAASVEE